ncbi:TetR/AcrR family transcriptional regulator [Pannonibacter sp. Pt2-lr]|uniref:TetR/AcrR family transcriptional regulator n=1 Tax=Pannonibacter anstelovis TaxID=3121537 RepID=A0ABU7ZSS7_9HYPH
MELERRSRGRPAVPEAVVQERIVAAAQRLLSSGGAAAMTMESVAAEAGIAKKTLYRFASSRADLIGLLVNSWIAPIFPRFETDPADFGAALGHILSEIAHAVLSRDAVGLFRMLASDADLRSRFLASYNANGIQQSRTALARWLDQQDRAGRVQLPIPAERVADLLLSATIAEPLRQMTLGLLEPLPAWDIAPRISDAVRLLGPAAGSAK